MPVLYKMVVSPETNLPITVFNNQERNNGETMNTKFNLILIALITVAIAACTGIYVS